MRCRLLGNSKHVLRWVVLFNDILLYASDFSIGTYFAPPPTRARHSARRKKARRESRRRRRVVNLSCIADRLRIAVAGGGAVLTPSPQTLVVAGVGLTRKLQFHKMFHLESLRVDDVPDKGTNNRNCPPTPLLLVVVRFHDASCYRVSVGWETPDACAWASGDCGVDVG